EFSSSDSDCHTPLPCEVRKGTIPHQERAVFTFKEGRIPVASPLSCCPKQTFGLRLRLNQPIARTGRFIGLPYRRTTRTARNGRLWNVRRDHSGLMPANLTALVHFSASAATKAPKSAALRIIGMVPTSLSRALMSAVASPANGSASNLLSKTGPVPPPTSRLRLR